MLTRVVLDICFKHSISSSSKKKRWAEKENKLQFRSAYVLREACQCLVVLWCWRKSQKSLVSPIYFNVTLSLRLRFTSCRSDLPRGWMMWAMCAAVGWLEWAKYRQVLSLDLFHCWLISRTYSDMISNHFRSHNSAHTHSTQGGSCHNCQVNFSSFVVLPSISPLSRRLENPSGKITNSNAEFHSGEN